MGLFGKDKDESKRRKTSMGRYSHIYLILGIIVLCIAVMELALHLHGSRKDSGGTFTSSVPPIPKRLHFIWKSATDIPPELQQNLDTWKHHNPDFKIKVWTDDDMLSYIRKHYDEYVHVFLGLKKVVERTDLFRYLLLYHEGGVYSDMDVVCVRPLESYINLRSDGLVVGWEGDWGKKTECEMAQSARKRLLLQWTFASSPQHPALDAVLSHVVRHWNSTFSKNAIRDTEERTGPIAFTDNVLQYTRIYTPGKVSLYASHPPVNLLPRAVWGVVTGQVETGQRSLVHQYMGSWKTTSRTSEQYGECGVSEIPVAPLTLLEWSPRLSLMTHVSGVGDTECSEDVSASLNNYGNWQAGLTAAARPNLQQMVGAIMTDAHNTVGSKGELVDIGAGYGVLSFAMASMGYRVLMFETAPKSLVSLRATIAYHGWATQTLLITKTLGNSTEQLCMLRSYPGTHVEEQRGYGRASQIPATGSPNCYDYGHRYVAVEALQEAQRPHVIRINANGYEPIIVSGLLPMLMDTGDGTYFVRRRPMALLLTWQPAWMEEVGKGNVAMMLKQLHDAGFTTLSLSYEASSVDPAGRACPEDNDLGATLFGYDMGQGSINWCISNIQQLLSDFTSWSLSSKPKHLIVLHEQLRVTGRHRMAGLGLRQ